MSMTLANLKLAVYSRLAPSMGTPAYGGVAEDNITRWVNESTSDVVKALAPVHYQALLEHNTSLTLTESGLDRVASLPADYMMPISLRVGSSYKRCHIFEDPDDYNRWDSSNFIYTPSSSKPISKIMDGMVFVRPVTGITQGLLDYVKEHPTISDSQPTVFSDIGDKLLIDLVVDRAMKTLEVMD